ncbi:FHA domain-containing protein [Archangium sp.]|uniref:FHA domain-containing protein n=1 Tax=Archangium sp. TaxID=1872627 RepID=UPI002EDAEA53
MSPPNPKRPPRSSRPPGESASRQEPEVELPFDDDEVAPLQADDPRPQRVPQYPAGPRRRPRRGSSGASREGRDREMPARFDSGEYEDPGHSPAFLYVERGPGAGQLQPLKQGVLVLGRASSSDLRLQHPSISRRHAQLTRRGDQLSLKDLGSQNGTFVNRVRLTGEVELHAGDEVALGNALLRVRGPGATPEPPRAAPSRTPSSLRVGMSARRVVLLSVAMGALLAVFLTLALVRLMRGKAEPASAPVAEWQAPPVEVAAPVPETPSADLAAPEEAPDPVPNPEPAAEPLPEEQLRAAPQTRPLSAQAIANKAGAKREQAPREIPARPKATGNRSALTTGKAAASSPAPSASPVVNKEAETEARTRYEAGDVGTALAIARGAHLDALSDRLVRFQAAWAAGSAALEAGDASTALQQLALARELDQELSQGWSRYEPRIRAALERAQTLSR